MLLETTYTCQEAKNSSSTCRQNMSVAKKNASSFYIPAQKVVLQSCPLETSGTGIRKKKETSGTGDQWTLCIFGAKVQHIILMCYFALMRISSARPVLY